MSLWAIKGTIIFHLYFWHAVMHVHQPSTLLEKKKNRSRNLNLVPSGTSNEAQWGLESPALNPTLQQFTQTVAVKKYSNKVVEYSDFKAKTCLISHSTHPIKALAGASTLKDVNINTCCHMLSFVTSVNCTSEQKCCI